MSARDREMMVPCPAPEPGGLSGVLVSRQSSAIPAPDVTDKLKDALSLAVHMLSHHEPGDSRAVSDRFVALAAVSCGVDTAADLEVIRDALTAAGGTP